MYSSSEEDDEDQVVRKIKDRMLLEYGSFLLDKDLAAYLGEEKAAGLVNVNSLKLW